VNDSCLWNNLELDSNNGKYYYKDESNWRRQTKIPLDYSTLCFERAKPRGSSQGAVIGETREIHWGPERKHVHIVSQKARSCRQNDRHTNSKWNKALWWCG
jgi:hypothetical protein